MIFTSKLIRKHSRENTLKALILYIIWKNEGKLQKNIPAITTLLLNKMNGMKMHRKKKNWLLWVCKQTYGVVDDKLLKKNCKLMCLIPQPFISILFAYWRTLHSNKIAKRCERYECKKKFWTTLNVYRSLFAIHCTCRYVDECSYKKMSSILWR